MEMAILPVNLTYIQLIVFSFFQLALFQEGRIEYIQANIKHIILNENDLSWENCIKVIDIFISMFGIEVNHAVSFFLLFNEEFCVIFCIASHSFTS